MDDLDSSSFDADTKGFSLIDVSVSDDDFLFSSSSEANAVDNQGDNLAEAAHEDKRTDLLAAQRPRKPGKCNLRKSLAWDSAFFTSAGVLDAEELSSIMEGAEAGLSKNHQLSGIQEELSKSTDSITTFESDSLTLESLEADLFCDIRASIQRSSMTPTSGNSKGEGKSGNGCSTKIGQPSSGIMVKPKLASRKLIPAVQGPSRMLKPPSISKQVSKPAVRGRDLSSTLPRSAAAINRANLEGTATSKRFSAGASHAKSEINQSGNIQCGGKEALISKATRPVDSRNTSQKSLASSKLSAASSLLNKTAIRRSQSLYNSSSCSSTTTTTMPVSRNDLGSVSSSSSPESIRRSQSDVRKKMEKNANLPPGPKIRTPSRLPMKNKPGPGESQLSAYVKSTLNPSPSISPASSVSEWSIESSSSTATVNQKSSGLKHGSTPEDAIEDNNVSQNTQKQSSKGTVMSQARPGPAKPSGLRLPSPKIGFFDGAKAGAKTPSNSARSSSALPSNPPRSLGGNHSPSGPANKGKPRSASVKGVTSVSKTSQLDPHKSQASPKINKQLQDHSIDLPRGNDSGTSSEVSKTTLRNPASESNSIIAKEEDRGKHVADSGNDVKKHSTDLQNDTFSMTVKDGSTELPQSTSTNSTLESNTNISEEADRGQQITNFTLIAKDCSEAGLQTSTVSYVDDEAETNFKILESSSTKTGRDSQLGDGEIAFSEEAKAGTKPPSGSVWSRSPLPSNFPDSAAGNLSPSRSAKPGSVTVKLSTSIVKTSKLDPHKSHTSPKLTKLQDHSMNDDSGTFSEVSKTIIPKSVLESNNTVSKANDGGKHVADSSLDDKNHLTGLQTDFVSMIVNDVSIGLPKSNSTLETNHQVSKEGTGGEQFAEVNLIAKDLSEFVQKKSSVTNFDDEYETNSDPLGCSSAEIRRVSKVAEVADEGEHQDDSGSCYKSDFIVFKKDASEERTSMVVKTVDGGKLIANSGLDQKDPIFMIGNDTLDAFIELPNSTSTNSALVRNTKVSEEADGGQHFAEVSLISKDQSEVVDEAETISELPRCSSPEIGRDTKFGEVKGRGKHFDDCGSDINSDISVSKKKESEERNIAVAREVNGGELIADSCSDADNHSTGLQKDPNLMILNNGSDNSIQLLKSATNSTLDSSIGVFELADGGKYSDEVVLKTSVVPDVGDKSETISELLESSSPEFGRDCKIAPHLKAPHRGEHPEDFRDDFIDPKKEGSGERNRTVAEAGDGEKHIAGSSLDAKNHSAGLQNDLVFMNIDVSDTSIKLPNSTSTNSVLERNTDVSEEADGGKHFDEANLIAKNHSKVVLKTSIVPNLLDEPETNSNIFRCSSSDIARVSEVSEVTDGGAHADDCGLAFEDLPTGNGAEISIELPKSTLNHSALERHSEVFVEGNGEEYFATVNLTAKDNVDVVKTPIVPNLDDKPKANLEQFGCSSPEIGRVDKDAELADGAEHPEDRVPPSNDDFIVSKNQASEERNISVTKAADGEKHVANSGFDEKDPVSMIVNDDSNTSIELPKSTSTNSTSERSSQISEESEVSLIAKDLLEFILKTSSLPNFDGNLETNSVFTCLSPKIRRDNNVADIMNGEHSDACVSTFKEDLVVSMKEESDDGPIDVVDNVPSVMCTTLLPDIRDSRVHSFVSDAVEVSEASVEVSSMAPLDKSSKENS